MGVSSLGVRTTNVTSGQACWEFRTPAGARPRVLEISVIQAAAGQNMTLGLGRPSSQGVNPVKQPFAPDDITEGNGFSALVAATSWDTSPGQPNTFIRRWNAANLIGLGQIWSFPQGLPMPPSASLVLWIISASALVCDVNCTVDE